MRLGLIIAALIIAADQVSKHLLIGLLETHGHIEVLPFFNLAMVWNYGISFGMFAGQEEVNRWILTAIAIAIVTILLFWLEKSRHALVSSAIGIIIGGALGNVIDRLRFGAVADFFDFHIAGYHWPAFNIADSCIFIGVALLCLEPIFNKPPKNTDVS